MQKLREKQKYGGICGDNIGGELKKCINCGTIEKTSNSYNYAGILGVNYNNGKVTNCYNIGTIYGYSCVGGISGSNCRENTNMNAVIENCYNVGTYSGNSVVGSISGTNGSNSTFLGDIIKNCYYKKGTTPIGLTYASIKTETFAFEDNAAGIADMLSKLGDAFVADEKNKDGNWIYNNGYPILKWQKEHNIVNK